MTQSDRISRGYVARALTVNVVSNSVYPSVWYGMDKRNEVPAFDDCTCKFPPSWRESPFTRSSPIPTLRRSSNPAPLSCTTRHDRSVRAVKATWMQPGRRSGNTCLSPGLDWNERWEIRWDQRNKVIRMYSRDCPESHHADRLCASFRHQPASTASLPCWKPRGASGSSRRSYPDGRTWSVPSSTRPSSSGHRTGAGGLGPSDQVDEHSRRADEWCRQAPDLRARLALSRVRAA